MHFSSLRPDALLWERTSSLERLTVCLICAADTRCVTCRDRITGNDAIGTAYLNLANIASPGGQVKGMFASSDYLMISSKCIDKRKSNDQGVGLGELVGKKRFSISTSRFLSQLYHLVRLPFRLYLLPLAKCGGVLDIC